MNKINKTLMYLNSDLTNFICFLIGALLILSSFFIKIKSEVLFLILISVGCSLVATSISVFLSSRYLLRLKTIEDMVNNWGLEAIYHSRQEMNIDADLTFPELKHELDIIAFGLKSFRDNKGSAIEDKVRRGLKVRILTIEPNSKYVAQREIDENEIEGQIKKTIEDLENWVNRLKLIAPNPKNVQIRFYNTLPLDFYWHQDDSVYAGPYMYGKGSQQTITYKFRNNSGGAEYYHKYFLELWNNAEFCQERKAS